MIRTLIAATALIASPALASVVGYHMTGTANGIGSLSAHSNIQLTLDVWVEELGSSLAPSINTWSFSARESDSTLLYARTGNGREGLTYTTFASSGGSSRRYIVVLENSAPGTISLPGSGSVTLTHIQFSYVAMRTTGGGNEVLGNSMNFADSTSSGSISLISTSGTFGALSSAGYAIPAPGVSCLLALAGFVPGLRRRHGIV